MVKLITAISAGVPADLREVITLGRTLKNRADDVLAYFDLPGTSNGPTEAINGRLELRFPPGRGGIDNEDRDAREAKEVRPGVP